METIPETGGQLLAVSEKPLSTASENTELLDTDLSKLGRSLEKQVRYIKRIKRDQLDASEYRGISAPASALINIGSLSSAAITWGITGNYPASASAGVVLAASLEIARPLVEDFRTAEIGLTDGFGMQSIRVNQAFEGLEGGDVVIAINPPSGFVGRETSALQTRRRLQEALIVASHATSADKILIPNSLLAATPFAGQASRVFSQFLANVKGRELHTTVNNDELALLIPQDTARELSEKLTVPNIAELFNQVLVALREKFPAKADKLIYNSDTGELLPLFLDLLRREVMSEAASSRGRVKYHSPYNMNYRDEMQPLVGSLDTAKSNYNPTVTVRNGKSWEMVESHSLRELTGASLWQETRSLMSEKLQTGAYTRLELLALGLQIMEELQNIEEDAAGERVELQKAEVSGSGVRKIQNKTEGLTSLYAKKHVAQCVGRIVLAASFLVPGAIFLGDEVKDLQRGRASAVSAATGYNDLSPNLSVAPGPQVPVPLWKVEAQTMSADGYYAAETRYQLDFTKNGPTWTNQEGAEFWQKREFPTHLASYDVPHIRLSRWMSQHEFTIPVKTNTRLAAMRATNRSGNAVGFTLQQSVDGTYKVTFKSGQEGAVHLEYEIIPDDDPGIYASRPLDVKAKLSDISEEIQNRAEQGVVAQAVGMRREFQYDDTAFLHKITKQRNSNDFLQKAYDEKHCNCNVCSTTLAIAQSAVHPHQHLAVTAGFWSGNEAAPYLLATEAHAWVTDAIGRVIEPQPVALGNGMVLTRESLDAHWSQQVVNATNTSERQKDSHPERLLLAMLGLAAIGIEARFGLGRRLATATALAGKSAVATQLISADEANRLLAYEAYGPKTGQPKMGNWSGTMKEQNIPSEVLRRVAEKDAVLGKELSKLQRWSLAAQARVLLARRKKRG